MEAQGIDAILLHSIENIYYATGFVCSTPYHIEEPYLLLLPREGERIFLSRRTDEPFISTQPPAKEIRYYGPSFADDSYELEYPDAMAALVASLNDRNLGNKKIATELNKFPAFFFDKIKHKFPKVILTDAKPLLDTFRYRKTAEEIRRMKEGVKITEVAIRGVIDSIREGVSEAELLAAFRSSLAASGAETKHAFIGGGQNNPISLPRPTRPSKTRLKRGDLVRLDLGAIFKDYCTDISRTVVIGKPSNRQLEIYRALENAQEAAFDALEPGRKCKEIYAAALSKLQEKGLGIPNIGHSIGLESPEPPEINADCEQLIEPNTVFAIEMFYFKQGFAGFQLEDMGVVTSKGFEKLTTLESHLISR